jgi:hypothetical protein
MTYKPHLDPITDQTDVWELLIRATAYLEEASACLQLVGRLPPEAFDTPSGTASRIAALKPEIDATVASIVASRERLDQLHSKLKAETN